MNTYKFPHIIYILLVVMALILLAEPFIIPLFFAATIALTLYPILDLLMRKGFKRNVASAILTSLFTMVISIPIFFFIIRGTLLVTSKLEYLPRVEKLPPQGVRELVSGIREDFIVSLHKILKKYHLDFFSDTKIDEYLSSMATFLLSFFRNVLADLPSIFIMLLVMILCLYSFLNHAPGIKIFFQKLFGFSDEKMEQLVSLFMNNARQVYLTNLITGIIQSLIVATSVFLLEKVDFFLAFFITLILSFIPVIGAAPVAFIFSFYSFLKGHSSSAIILLVLGGVTGIIDNILRPWLASLGVSKISPVVSFICVIGGVLWLGFPGLFVGLLLAPIAFDTLPIFWKEMSRQDVEDIKRPL
jgi:predicted PurR-regulated permease PerM